MTFVAHPKSLSRMMGALPAALVRLSVRRHGVASQDRYVAARKIGTIGGDDEAPPEPSTLQSGQNPALRSVRLNRFAARVWNDARPFRQPVVGFGLALIASFWTAAEILIAQDHAAVRLQAQRDAANLALVFERNVAHTIGDLDRALLFFRWARANAPADLKWPEIISRKFAANADGAQTSVVDANGLVVTSEAFPGPNTPVNFADRETYLAQLRSKGDELFIGRPVADGASGEWSVQFARKLTDAHGRFAGAVVISLDAARLAHDSAELNLGPDAGLAVVGDDGIVRAGSGAFASFIARPLADRENRAASRSEPAPATLIAANASGMASAARGVEGAPLKVIVAIPNGQSNPRWTVRARADIAVAAAASLAALFTTIAVALRRHRSEARLRHLARYDALTNLSNRRQLIERLDALFDRPAEDRAYALHIVDLDRFKFVNDTYGHPFGDRLLKLVADRLLALAKPSDLVVRLGGDEFAVMQSLWNSRVDARTLADRICRELAEPFEVGQVKVVIGATVGIASATDDATKTAELLKAADLALYAAKSEDRGGFRFYHPAMTRAIRERTDIESGLRAAIARGELQLHYQPIVSLADRQTIGYEALIRWRRPGHGIVPPSAFIPVAEETGLIAKIGDWVLHRACADVAALRSPLRVAVNCSPLQFELSDVAERVQAALNWSGLAPGRLEIEITESALMKNNHRVVEQLSRLHAIGVRISMDDFGTGFSSLSYLERFPITTIKIDRSFVQKLGQREGAAATIRAIIELASSYKMTALAEGVGTAAQLEALIELGCDHAQGYLFGRPKPIHELWRERPAPSVATA